MSVALGDNFLLLEYQSSQWEANYFLMISDMCRLLTWKWSSPLTRVSGHDLSIVHRFPCMQGWGFVRARGHGEPGAPSITAASLLGGQVIKYSLFFLFFFSFPFFPLEGNRQKRSSKIKEQCGYSRHEAPTKTLARRALVRDRPTGNKYEMNRVQGEPEGD